MDNCCFPPNSPRTDVNTKILKTRSLWGEFHPRAVLKNPQTLDSGLQEAYEGKPQGNVAQMESWFSNSGKAARGRCDKGNFLFSHHNCPHLPSPVENSDVKQHSRDGIPIKLTT